MNAARRWGKKLLWLHLFVCLVWLAVLRESGEMPEWYIHVIIWSVLGIQFSWGFTVGLLVGPNRARRDMLWWSLMTIFLPLWPLGIWIRVMMEFSGPLVALIYALVFAVLLGCETFCGVLLGVKSHSADSGQGD